MHVCLCTISYREKLLDVALEAAARVGFDAVELWGREPHVVEEYDESRIKGIRHMVEDLGLKVPVLGSYLYFGKTTHREDSVTLFDTLQTAHGLHAPVVRVWASDVPSATATEEVWAATVSEAQEACDRAAKMNVMFAAEMHDHTLADTGESARRLVEAVNRPNFRLNFQISTDFREDQRARLELALPYVVHMHCQNFVPSAHDGYQRTQLDAGFVNYQPFMDRLKEMGYGGCVAIEFAAEEGDRKEASLKKDLEYLVAL
ncbi:MAG: sugar phosphate isomerase/epimerase family protein [Armatimonadota bacterium]